MKAYPTAKVLLTTRTPESWYTSVKGSIFGTVELSKSWVNVAFIKLIGRHSMFSTVQRICFKEPKGFKHGMFGAIGAGPDASKTFFNQWVDEVKKTVPADRLLVFSVKEGWEPLCKFLEVPVPDQPFPRVNDTATIKKNMKMNKTMSHVTIIGGPLLLSGLVYAFCRFFIKYTFTPL